MLVSGRISVGYRFGSPFSSKVVVFGHGLVTLSLTVNKTLKRLSLLPISMQVSFWWWQCSDRYIISPSPSFSPSLISLMVSVDVKHHVYLLMKVPTDTERLWVSYVYWKITWTCGTLFSNRTRPRALVRNQHTRELISARNTSHRYNNKDQSRPR